MEQTTRHHGYSDSQKGPDLKVYIQLHAPTYTYIHIHTYIYIHIHTHSYTCIHTNTYIHKYTYVHRPTHIYIYTYIPIYIYIHVTWMPYTLPLSLLITRSGRSRLCDASLIGGGQYFYQSSKGQAQTSRAIDQAELLMHLLRLSLSHQHHMLLSNIIDTSHDAMTSASSAIRQYSP